MSEFGNYPLVQNMNLTENVDQDLRPKNYYWRMKLPADAEWAPRQADEADKDDKKKKKKRKAEEL